jgi:hypothetical protein
MNYSDLASTLLHLGERLAKHAGKIDGEILGRSARMLTAQLNAFEENLESYLASRKSGEFLLENLLRSPAAKRHLTVEMLKHGLREVVGKRLKSDDLPAAKREFIELVHEFGKQNKAAEFLQEAFADAFHVESGGKDKLRLQREFINLGQLADEEFAQEIGKRTFGELRRVASVNGIRFTDKTTKQRLTALIRRYAQRAAFNIAAARVPSHIER